MRGLAGWRAAGFALALIMVAQPAQAACELLKYFEMKVRFENNRAYVDGTVNGQQIVAIIDTGASFSMIVRSSADMLQLKRRRMQRVKAVGIGGASNVDYAKVDHMEVGPFRGDDFNMPVTGEGFADFDFILGQDMLSRFDVEFDLANGVINFFKPKGCEDAALAYWARDGWAEAKLEKRSRDDSGFGAPGIRIRAQVNGVPVRADLDTGAPTSVLTLRAAERAGLAPGNPGVEPLGHTGGIGKHRIAQWRATFDSFVIGEETITNAKIRIADLFAHAPPGASPPDGVTEMLLGADFFQAHRVYIANSQRKAYFTHNGGPVFQVVYDPEAAEAAEVEAPP